MINDDWMRLQVAAVALKECYRMLSFRVSHARHTEGRTVAA
jgi:hypothetical protein